MDRRMFNMMTFTENKNKRKEIIKLRDS
jgi:hypothetical protein